MKNALRPLSRLRSWLVARLLPALGFLWLGHGLADPYPPAWNGGAGAAVHYPPVAWPAENGWTAYTMQGANQKDAKNQDPSNGGTSPQNYVNVTSGCTDLIEPSIYYAYDAANQVIFFRWRVQQQANTYATGPSAGSFASTDPWRSALWTVLIDVNGDGYRDFAVQLDGSSGAPAVPVDLLTSYYSTTLSQTINLSDPNTYLVDHNPSAFTSGSTILNFQESLTPVTTWPSGSSATVWDYGTTRSKLVPGAANTCGEFFIDYQIPLGLLDASAFGGPTITPSTPFAMLFATSNSLQNPLQKDVVYMGDFIGKDSEPGPFGDLITLNGTVQQPVVQSVATAGCGNATLTAKVLDSTTLVGGVLVSTIAGVDFYYYADSNGNGLADDGNSWTLAALGSSTQIGTWTATWNSTGLPKGQYLIGVQALDNVAYNKNPDGSLSGIAHRTFSYLSTAQLPANAPGEQNFANPAPAPGVVYATFVNTCGLEPPSVTKTVSASAVSVGATVTYTVTVHNPGPAPVPLGSISDVLPVGFSYVATTGGTLHPAATEPTPGDTGTITWTFVPATSIPATGTATLLFTANVGTVQGTYNNVATAVVDGDTLTSDPVQVAVGAPRLTMAKSASPASVSQGAPVTFTFTYSNDSPVDVTGVVIEDSIPAGTTYVSGSLEVDGVPQSDAADGDLAHYDAGAPARVLFTLGTIPAGEGPFTASFQVLVNNPYPPSAPVPLANTATIDGNETDPVDATSYTYIDVPRPYLTIQKSASTVLVAPGNQVVYTINYQNTGTAAATGVTITDVVPPGFTFVSATGGGVHAAGTVTWTIGDVAAGASASVTLTLTAGNPFTAANPSTNTATIDSDQTDPVAASAQVGVTVTGTACSTYYFRNTLADVGFDGNQRIANDTEVLAGDTGTGVLVTAPLDQAYIEAVRFYEDPSMPYDVEFAGTITTNFYIDRVNGPGITIRATVYNYNSTTGAKTAIGTSTTSFAGNQKGLLTYTVNATGTLSAGNRLLWVYEVKSNNNVQTADILFQFGGTVANSLSGTAPATFANSSSNYCVTPPAVLVMDKQASLALAQPGDAIAYTIRFANTGVSHATGATVVDTLPTGVTFVNATLNGNPVVPAISGQQLTFTVNSLDTATAGRVSGGQSGTLVVNATVNAPLAPGITSLLNTAVLDSDQIVPISDTTLTLVQAPALTVTKSASDTLLIPGETVTYSITVLNGGTGPATNVTVTDDIPDQTYFEYVDGSIAGGDSRSTSGAPVGALQWIVSSLAPGATATVTFQMRVRDTAPLAPDGVTTLGNSASVASNQTAAAASDPVTVTISTNPNLHLAKSVAEASPRSPGDTLTYTLLISNDGSSAATGVLVFDPIPAYTAYLNGTLTVDAVTQTDVHDGDFGWFDAVNNRIVLELGSLAPGASVAVEFKVAIFPTLPVGTTVVANSATLSASNAAAKSDTATVEAEAAPVLQLAKSGPGAIAYPAATVDGNYIAVTKFLVSNAANLPLGGVVRVAGQDRTVVGIDGLEVEVDAPVTASHGDPVFASIAYTLAYSNTGNATTTGVVLTDTLPAGSILYSVSPAQDSGPDPLQWNLGTLAVGESGTITVVIFPGGPGELTNTATLDSAETAPVGDSVTTGVGGVLVTKATSTPLVYNGPGGSTATWTITVTNQRAVNAEGVVITDVLEPGFSYASTTSITYGGGGGSRPVTADPAFGATEPAWGNFTINGGGSVSITFVANIAPNAGVGVYQNYVEVTSSNLSVIPFNPLDTPDEDVEVDYLLVDLSLTKTPSTLAPAIGDTVTFTLALNNADGFDTATGIVVQDVLPNGYVYVPGSIAPAADPNVTPDDSGYPATLSWAIASLPANTTVNLTYQAVVQPNAPGIVYVNKAQVVSADQYDADSTPNDNTGDDFSSVNLPPANPTTGTIQGTVYLDVDGDGLYTPADTPLPGVAVTVTDSLGNVHFLTTDLNGEYSVVVPAGDTTVDVDNATLPAGYTLTTNANGQGSDPATVTVPDGGSAAVATGYLDSTGTAGTVQGTIYLDVDGDGLYTPGTDTPLAGVNVTVTDSNGGVYILTTDSNGEYSALVAAGDATVDVDNADLPAGYTLTTNANGQGSDPTLVAVPADGSVDASTGYLDSTGTAGTVQGTIYLDVDGDGLYTQDIDTPLAGVDVTVTDSNGGVYILTTDSNGWYSVLVAAGNAVVDVDDATLPTGLILTTNANGQGSDPATVAVPAGGSVTAGTGYLYTSTLAKTVVSGSPAPIGGVVVYSLVLAIPTATIHGVTITDDLPADFSFVPGSVSVANAPGLATGYVDEATSVATPAGQIVFTLGSVVCTNLAPNNTVTIQYQALVGNAASNQDGAVKTNSATAQGTGVPDSADTADVTIHEPLLVCSKTFENVTKCGPLTTKKLPAHRPQSNDVLRFTTTVANTSATATAYDVNLLDMVGAAGGAWFDTLTLVVESATLNGAPWAGTTLPAIAGTLLTWGTGNGGDSSIDIAPGQTFEIVYRVTANALGDGGDLTRSVTAYWTSLDGASAGERTGSGGLNDYTASFAHVLYSFNSAPTEHTVLGGDTATLDASGNLDPDGDTAIDHVLLGGERLVLADGSALEVTGDGLPPAAQGYLNITLPAGASATIRQTGDFVVDHLILGDGATLRIIQGARGITIDYGALDMGIGSTLIFPDDATVIFGPATIQGASGAASLATIRPTTKNGGLTLVFTCVTNIQYAHFAGIDDGYVNFQGPTAMDHAVFSGGDGTNPYVIYEYPAAVVWSNLAFRKEDGATTTIQNTQTDADTLYHITVDGYLGPTQLNYIGGNSTDIEPAGTTDDDPNSGVRWSNATPAYGVEAALEAPATGGVLVKWSAQVEIGVLKYLVQVSDGRAWTTLGEEFARTEGIRGGSYGFLDRQARPGETRRYRLLCVDVDGTTREHAAGEATAVAEAPAAETIRAAIPAFPADGVAAVRELHYEVQRHASETPAVLGVARKATVAKGGLYQRGDAGRILNLGRELPDLGGLVYIRPYTDPYTDANVVWDFAGPFETDGEPGEPPAPPAQGLLGPGGYFAVVHVEKDETLALNSMLPPGPNWFYGYANRLAPGNAPILVANVPAPAATGTAVLEVAVRSTSDGDHDLGATVNGVPVARALWTGKGHHLVRFEFDLAACPLADGENRIQLWATTAGSSKRLDYLRVITPATPALRDGGLVVDVLEGGDGTLHLPGAVHAIDITDFGRETLLGNRRGAFAGLQPGRKLHFADHAGTLDWSEPKDLAAVDRALAGREHVSVAPAAWLDLLDSLAAKRRDEGLDAAAVAWEDVRDAYGAGLPTPAGLVRLGRRLGPQYLLLAACATHDPKGLQGTLPPPGIPTGFVHVYEGTASTDDLYADGFAIAVGRLPARSRTELANMVNKIVDFHPGRRAVMVADVDDGGMSFGSFAQLQGELAARLPSVLLDANTMNGTTLRAALVAAVNDGANLVTYQGHGNNALIGDRFDILNTSHAAQIPPSAWLFATCLTGIHTLEEDGTGVLASALLRTPGNGAVSVLASTCYGQAATEHRIAETAVRLTAAGGATWGGILLEVKRTLMPNETAAVYTLLGDPAMRTLSPVAGDREILVREPLAGAYLNADRPPEIRFALRGGWWRQTLEILWRRDHGEWTPLARIQIDPEVFEYTVPWDPPPADGAGYQIMIREVAAEGGSN